MASLLELSKVLSRKMDMQRSEVAIVELDEITDSPSLDMPILKFQYFPETITDSYSPNYASHNIPGGSVPILQWVSGNPRTISFEAIFTCDTDLLADGPEQGVYLLSRLKGMGQADRNIDIRSALLWLRRFTQPRYTTGEVGPTSALTYAPRSLFLIIPNSGIGLLGGSVDSKGTIIKDSIYCKMMSCEITYQMFHPSGLPKIARVQLSFQQTAQIGGNVQFPGASPDMDKQVGGVSLANNGVINKFVSNPNDYYGYPLVAKGVSKNETGINSITSDSVKQIGGAFNNGNASRNLQTVPNPRGRLRQAADVIRRTR